MSESKIIAHLRLRDLAFHSVWLNLTSNGHARTVNALSV